MRRLMRQGGRERGGGGEGAVGEEPGGTRGL